MLDTFTFAVIFAVTIGVLYAISFLLWKAGLLKQALITLITVLLLGGVAIASGHAEETRAAVVVAKDDNVIILFDASGLYWLWEEEETPEEYELFDVVTFTLIDVNNTPSIKDDKISKPEYSGLQVDRTWLLQKLSKSSI